MSSSKTVNIHIGACDIADLADGRYNLCFAKRVEHSAFNVVWRSYSRYTPFNMVSWTLEYELLATNFFKSGATVTQITYNLPVCLGDKTTLNKYGVFGLVSTGNFPDAITLMNEYGAIHPGVGQYLTGVDGTGSITPIFIAEDPMIPGLIDLTPIDEVLVWFEQGIKTSTMFVSPPPNGVYTSDARTERLASGARTAGVVIDLTTTDSATRLFQDSKWSIP